MSLIVPSGIVSHPGNNTAAVFINDSLGLPLRVPVHVIVVVDNGTANASAEVTLRPGVDVAVVNDIYVKPGSQVTVYLYAPLNVSQLGSYVVPVSSYGLLIGSSTFEANQLTFNPSLVHIANSATSTLQNTSSSHSAPSSYYVWAIVALVIVAVIIAVTIGYLRV
jgi:hypothetical protein